jgi:hypothetical protein
MFYRILRCNPEDKDKSYKAFQLGDSHFNTISQCGVLGCHFAQHDDTQHFDPQNDDIQHDDIQYNDTQRNNNISETHSMNDVHHNNTQYLSLCRISCFYCYAECCVALSGTAALG